MGRGRRFDKKTRVRPKKTPSQTRQRDNVHRKRLVALGLSEETVKTMDAKRMRELLKRPLRTKAMLRK